MAKYPEPKAGLVVSYAYLWSEELEKGQTEGRKDRPCAIILAVEHTEPDGNKRKRVAVAPITHSPPSDPNTAIEIPLRVKQYLRLDSERSWIVLDEINEFMWPGFDLRPVKGDDSRVEYGLLPPKLFEQLISKFTELHASQKVARVSRDE
jgi:hypothetical protein